MQISDQKNKTKKGGVRGLKTLIAAALLIALSMTLKRFSITAGPFRFSLENLPLLLSGIMLGPVVGFVCGVAADILGCFISGFTIIPIITLGAAVIGCVPGIVYGRCLKNRPALRIIAAVGLAHLIGSVIIKSIGLHLAYGSPWTMLALRVPLYIITGAVEAYIIYLLMKNKAFVRHIEDMRK